MLKKDVSSEQLKIYELYFQRIMKECDLIWSRFKIYFGFHSGLLIVIGFLLKPYIKSAFSDIADILLYILLALSLIGILFSVLWFLVNRDGRKWMLLMNVILGKVEDAIFEKEDCALYKKINTEYPPECKWKTDVMDISSYTIGSFFLIWLVLSIFLIVVFGDC